MKLHWLAGNPMFKRIRIISLGIDQVTFQEAIDQIMEWGLRRTSAFACFANVHMVIEAHKDPEFRQQLEDAALMLPDGKPVALSCRLLFGKKQERISGMDFMPRILESANAARATVFLYGTTPVVLESLREKITHTYPQVTIGGAISPPFRQLTEEEIQLHINQINQSGANLVLVALGCPKQEKWMAAHYKKINAVLLGLGGAFPVTAGIQKRSPQWMQNWALEWLYRLLQEPKRMFKRYLYTNSYFIWLLTKEWIKKNL